MSAAALRDPALQPLVLIGLPVDDERDMYQAHLSFDGFRTETACTTEELWSKARSAAPDAIVIGQYLQPGGEEVCRALKAEPTLQAVPCVLLASSRTSPCPSDSTLVRPVLPQVLADTVRLLIKKSGTTI